ncbi:MAG: hypothetical protein MRZ79_27590 [Bacteroidia bacterium]|nr:hypothetical protein [Bacteroidia bacterium]
MEEKNPVLSYFIEIVIIILGVVIAFYLTEYGEQLSRNQNEKDVINQIYFELKDNLEDMERDFQVHRIGMYGNLRVLKYLNEKSELTDSLIMDFYWMAQDEYIFPNTSGYENLKSFGLNLIKDDSLRNLITLVYNHDMPRLEKGNTLHQDINEYLTPFLQKHFAFNQDTSLKYTITFNDSLQVNFPGKLPLGINRMIGYVPLDPKGLQENEEFRFLATNALEYRLYKLNFYYGCITNVKKTINRIEEIRS